MVGGTTTTDFLLLGNTIVGGGGVVDDVVPFGLATAPARSSASYFALSSAFSSTADSTLEPPATGAAGGGRPEPAANDPFRRGGEVGMRPLAAEADPDAPPSLGEVTFR